MNYFKLAYTTPDVLVKIKEAEKRGDFNAHLDPVDYDSSLPVDEKFPYIPTGALKFRQALIRTFIIKPFMWIVNRFIFRTRIYSFYEEGEGECGEDNHGMIITCNHINKLDALVVELSLIHISEPTRRTPISYAVFCLKKKKTKKKPNRNN